MVYVVMIGQMKFKLYSITFRLMELNAFSASVKRIGSVLYLHFQKKYLALRVWLLLLLVPLCVILFDLSSMLKLSRNKVFTVSCFVILSV